MKNRLIKQCLNVSVFVDILMYSIHGVSTGATSEARTRTPISPAA